MSPLPKFRFGYAPKWGSFTFEGSWSDSVSEAPPAFSCSSVVVLRAYDNTW